MGKICETCGQPKTFENEKKNIGKWNLLLEDRYMVNGQVVVRTHVVAIPPTSGDRTDIIGESRKYYYNMTKKEFNARLTPEEYLESNLPGLDEKDKVKALKQIDWTPRKIDDEISIIIEIKNGIVTISGK